MNVGRFVKDLIHIKQTNDSLTRVIGAGLSVALPMLIGLWSGNMKFGTLGALGAFAFLSYTPLHIPKLAKRILKAGLGIMAGFYLGLLSTLIPWTIPIAISFVSLAGFLVVRCLQIPNPGAFFLIMVSSMGTGMKLEFSQMLPAVGYVGGGVLASILMAVLTGYINQYYLKRPVEDNHKSYKERIKYAIEHDSDLLLTSIHHAGIIFFAAYISQALGFMNPYWVTISTAAVLAGKEIRIVFYRNVQRIVGGLVGLIIGFYLLSLHLDVIPTIILIVIFTFLVEFCMVRNYAVANFFTNPVSLMLSHLSSGLFITDLVQYRLLGLVVGSIIGFIGAALIELGLRIKEKRFTFLK